MNLKIIYKPFSQLTDSENAQIDEISRLAYFDPNWEPPDPSGNSSAEDGIDWAEPQQCIFGLYGDQIVSVLFLLQRAIVVGNEPVLVAGLGSVATHPDFQRRGFAGQLLQKAAGIMRDEMSVPFGLLVCSPSREPYYQKFGWLPLSDPVEFSVRGQSRVWHESTMVLPLAGQSWPGGAVNLCGKPW